MLNSFFNKNRMSYEEHLLEIQKKLELKRIPEFTFGKKEIIKHCEKSSGFSERQIQSLKKADINGLFLWIDDYRVCIVHKELNKIGTAAHELRHAYQYQQKPDSFSKEKYPIFVYNKSLMKFIGQLSYIFNLKELDANFFALRYCFKQKMYQEFFRYTLRTLRPFFLVLGFLMYIVIMKMYIE